MAKIIAGHRGQRALLVAVNRSFGGLHVVGGARLNLNKTEHIAVPPDEIDFSAMVRRAVVASDHDVSRAPQMKISGLFTAATGYLMSGSIAMRQSAVREPIKNADDRVGQAAR